MCVSVKLVLVSSATCVVWNHKTSLSSTLLYEVSIAIHESCRSSICVLGY